MNKNNLHYIALLLLILLIASISLANMQSVTVNFLLVQFKLPLIILILLCVLLGAFVMTLVNFSKGFSLKKELKSTQKQLEEDSTRTLGNQVIKPLAMGIKRMARVKIVLKTLPR